MHIELAFYSCGALKVCHGQNWRSVVSSTLSDSVVPVVGKYCVLVYLWDKFNRSNKLEAAEKSVNSAGKSQTTSE